MSLQIMGSVGERRPAGAGAFVTGVARIWLCWNPVQAMMGVLQVRIPDRVFPQGLSRAVDHGDIAEVSGD